jgi:hypothetical protein
MIAERRRVVILVEWESILLHSSTKHTLSKCRSDESMCIYFIQVKMHPKNETT